MVEHSWEVSALGVGLDCCCKEGNIATSLSPQQLSLEPVCVQPGTLPSCLAVLSCPGPLEPQTMVGTILAKCIFVSYAVEGFSHSGQIQWREDAVQSPWPGTGNNCLRLYKYHIPVTPSSGLSAVSQSSQPPRRLACLLFPVLPSQGSEVGLFVQSPTNPQV